MMIFFDFKIPKESILKESLISWIADFIFHISDFDFFFLDFSIFGEKFMIFRPESLGNPMYFENGEGGHLFIG